MNWRLRINWTAFLAGMLSIAIWPSLFAQSPTPSVDRVVVYKQERKLVLL